MLEYRNKTWSNLDLALRLKKGLSPSLLYYLKLQWTNNVLITIDIIKALISHTGAILENKITNHRPNRPQPNLLRMMANNSSIGTNSTTTKFAASESDLTIADVTSTLSDRDHISSAPISRSTIGSRNSGQASNSPWTVASSRASRITTATTSTTSSTASTENTDFPGPPPPPPPPPPPETGHGIFHHTLSRLTHSRGRDGTADDTEENIKKKSRMLLGKKVFGNGWCLVTTQHTHRIPLKATCFPISFTYFVSYIILLLASIYFLRLCDFSPYIHLYTTSRRSDCTYSTPHTYVTLSIAFIPVLPLPFLNSLFSLCPSKSKS